MAESGKMLPYLSRNDQMDLYTGGTLHIMHHKKGSSHNNKFGSDTQIGLHNLMTEYLN